MRAKAEQVVRDWRDGGREPDGLARALATALTEAERAGRRDLARELLKTADEHGAEAAIAWLREQVAEKERA